MLTLLYDLLIERNDIVWFDKITRISVLLENRESVTYSEDKEHECMSICRSRGVWMEMPVGRDTSPRGKAPLSLEVCAVVNSR